MTLVPLFDLTQQFNNKNGAILVGGRLYVYYIGRTDLATTWADEDAQATNPNPVLLDNNGRAPVFVDDSYAYTLVVCDRNGVELFSQDITPGGAGSAGGRIVYHDETLTGNGTVASLLGANTFPLGVDETMTAYTGVAEGRDALILGVNGEWFNDTFGNALSSKVDWSAFNSAFSGLKGLIDNKADWSALNNYYTKNEIDNRTSSFVNYNFLSSNYYSKNETSSREELYNAFRDLDDRKQDKLEFGYDENSAISSINNSALAGQGGDNCPWISGSKEIADTQVMTGNMLIQILSSFDLSGDHNHFIGMKGGTYRFPNEYEIGSALLHTNYFMHQSAMSAYVPYSSFNTYSSNISEALQHNWDYTNSAYNMSLSNFYNKLDISAFSAYSAGQDTTINNITEQITNISNASGNWNDISAYQQNSANYLTGINIPESASWNEATNVVQTNSANWNNKLDLSAFENASGNFYPMTGNPSGFLTGVDISNYYQKNETSSKSEIENALSNKLDTTAFTAWSSTIFDGDYELSAGEGISITDDIPNQKTIITNNISAGTNISLVYDQDTNKIRIDCNEVGRTYSGITPIQVNNSTNQISISGEELSAGPNIDIFSSGGYVIISANGGNTFPITGTDGTANYTANANFSSFTLTTGQGVTGSLLNLDVNNVSYLAYPSTSASASWYNIIQKANEPSSNCYCIRFTDNMTATNLSSYLDYDKVTVVNSNTFSPNCMLYWNGKTKVFPSGFYCELVKGTDEQNQIDWFFTTSGWTNDIWWDLD